MSTPNVKILNEKLASLPRESREKIAQYISQHFDDITDELRWDESFERTSSKLADAARRARKDISEGKAVEMDLEKL